MKKKNYGPDDVTGVTASTSRIGLIPLPNMSDGDFCADHWYIASSETRKHFMASMYISRRRDIISPFHRRI